MSQLSQREAYLPSIINLLEDTGQQMSPRDVVIALFARERRTLSVVDCARLMRTAAVARVLVRVPQSTAEAPAYVTAKRMFPESGNPMDEDTRPVASVWELATGPRIPWAHKEPKQSEPPQEQPARKQPAQERPEA